MLKRNALPLNLTQFQPKLNRHQALIVFFQYPMTHNTKDMANAIRALAMDAVQAANSGHPGAPMGMADMAVALWGRHLRDRKSTRLNSSHVSQSRMPSSA